MSGSEDISKELEACSHPVSDDGSKGKQKREKKTELAPGVPVSQRSLFNRLFVLLSSEAQCRQVSPLTLARLATTYEAGIAIVIGENKEQFTEAYFDGQKAVFAELNRKKLEENPLDVTTQVFNYETIRPKRERDPNAPPSSKRRKVAHDSDSDEEEGQIVEKKPKTDAEGNVVY